MSRNRFKSGAWLSLLAALALLPFSVSAVHAAAPATTPAAEDKVLNVYNWSDYIAEDTIRNFEKETGIKVRYDSFDNNEIVHAKLVAGHTGYDVVVPTAYWAKLQAEGGLLRKLDKSLLPNLANLDPALQAQLAVLDPGNQFMVTWLWGFSTIGINVDKVRAALGPLPMPANAWDLLFKPAYVSRLTACGVSVMDSATEVVPAALHYLGKPAFSRVLGDYKDVPALLQSIRPSITLFSSSGYINDLANGSLCMVLGWSGDINIARQRAIDGKTGQHIEALIPPTGGLLFMDTMVIPSDAPHPLNAHRFINYILRPEVHAAITNKVFYANPNLSSRPFIKPEIRSNPSVFPAPADMARMVVSQPLNNDARRKMNRIFTSFKTEQ
ncbi:polyamine ABC transporter substrate-binding protein [Roseateles koreensis]|uniref:Putrescine-binding periplasmic protein n=1 Tax=Roseateles koreensis TaxID=2987526 RepID=A0ABT5KV99_9BURK|nr:polyamine ABC transporter substrate-binding protein [Roseateles koreensis]MDC8786870.1 polyamine ABC transporter substrate-binding protein [Roseateles koreensis]